MKGVFLTIFSIFLVFNFFYLSMYPETSLDMYTGAVLGLIGTVIATGIIGGISILGSGLNSESIKIIFGAGTLFNLLFNIEIPQLGLNIGLGLATNIISLFDSGDILNLGFISTTALSLIALVSGLMVIID